MMLGAFSKTFEQLRKEKEADFAELEDGKRVSWTMEYGKITKTIPKPKDVIIYAAKAEIEKSEFLFWCIGILLFSSGCGTSTGVISC